MLPFEIESAVVCDDVRLEASGKQILIGVYAGSITIFQLPGNIALTLWLDTTPLKREKLQGEARVVSDDGSALAQGKFQFDTTSPRERVLALERIPMQIQRYGKIQFQIKMEGAEEWSIIKEMDVIPPPLPAVPQITS